MQGFETQTAKRLPKRLPKFMDKVAAISVWQTDLDKADKRLCAQNLVLITVYRPTCLPIFFRLPTLLEVKIQKCR